MLSPRAVLMLPELGISGGLEDLGAVECPGTRTIWKEGDAVRRSIMDLSGSGWIVERERFDKFLGETAGLAGVAVVEGRVRGVSNAGTGWLVEIDQHISLSAEKLVVATGRSPSIARQLGVLRQEWSEEITLLGRVEGVASQWRADPLLLVERAEYGWLYGLPCDGNGVIGVTVEPRFLASRPLEAAWRGAVEASGLHRRFCGGSRLNQVWAQPSGLAYAFEGRGPDWALAGDAAMSCGPISGQGLAFALESGVRAARSFVGGAGSEMTYEDWLAGEQSRYQAAAQELLAAA
jgi:flavin-dependent dehydrogenase